MFRSIIQQLVVQCDSYRNLHLQAAQEIAQLKNENVTLKKKIQDLQLEIEKLKVPIYLIHFSAYIKTGPIQSVDHRNLFKMRHNMCRKLI
jgi:cell division protein FtsB